MIRSILICSALVASSAAGAVALSVMHDASPLDRSVRTLAPAPEATVEAAFVIPSFAPAPRPEPQQARVAPFASPELPATDAVPRVLPQVTSAEQQVVRPPITTKQVVKTPAQTVRILKPRRKAAARRSSNLPVIVAQAPSFRASAQGAVEPQYLIGVFR